MCLDRSDGRAVEVMERLVSEGECDRCMCALRVCADVMDVGKVKPVIDSTYAFADVLKAYEKMMGAHAAGKVVVNVEE